MRLDRRADKIEANNQTFGYGRDGQNNGVLFAAGVQGQKRRATQANNRKRHISIRYASIQRIHSEENMWTIVVYLLRLPYTRKFREISYVLLGEV